MLEPVLMDLGDFVPESYAFKFSINGHRYEFRYEEATVDEVLKLMLAAPEGEGHIEKSRGIVTAFLKKVVVSGDAGVLEEDLKQVPYKSSREELDILTLYQLIQSRIKKKVPGESVKAAA